MGKWIVESDFIYEGLRCVVAFQKLGHRCGYVGVPYGHKLFDVDYFKAEEELDTYVHGGLTYAGNSIKSGYPVESDLWWLGFDCAHHIDGKDLELAKEYFKDSEDILREINITAEIERRYPSMGTTVRSKSYVEDECKKLVEEIIKYVNSK